MNELMITIRILMKQSLPYVFTLKELNYDLFQQYTFHISTSKPLNNSLRTWLCVCVGYARTRMDVYVCVHVHVSMHIYEVAWIHSWSVMSSSVYLTKTHWNAQM